MVQAAAGRRTESRERIQVKKLTSARDIYQLLVGEIGIPRHEFLYELKFWEINRIIRGYRRRGRLRNQLIAECVFAAMHVMRDSKGKTPKDFFPGLFEDDEDKDPVEPMSDEDHAYEQELMRRWEEAQQQKKAQK